MVYNILDYVNYRNHKRSFASKSKEVPIVDALNLKPNTLGSLLAWSASAQGSF